MQHSAEFFRCMVAMDVAVARRLWAHMNAHLYQPASDDEMAIVLHHARTQSDQVPLRKRAYSHAWLRERSLPTGLPDALRPAAERLYPVIVDAVAISCRGSSPLMAPIVGLVRKSMENAIEDAYAEGRREPGFVRARMEEARQGTVKKLLGRVGSLQR